MSPIIIISIFVGLIFILLAFGATKKPLRIVGQSMMKLLIGALLLFFLNLAGSKIGIHVPINFATSVVSGFLGIPGVLALVAIQRFILP
ncbi:pro-sigmaK processing inhibitor BofA family protein [Bacillus chungangensis]|uniref:Inhibitor of the pro-sigma K processing machinery n=1 Tax=Bacillus chungangensis TaxID=587633 RepID=A0ABT9WSY9_9BACI|nr:pro-sigmaK processing inhibitor BofA family protein [Bacillus chungangensis]MDQ0176337.1 inhibitor of the pro-sigma K processing machinery [Bacillus chungangensis]